MDYENRPMMGVTVYTVRIFASNGPDRHRQPEFLVKLPTGHLRWFCADDVGWEATQQILARKELAATNFSEGVVAAFERWEAQLLKGVNNDER